MSPQVAYEKLKGQFTQIAKEQYRKRLASPAAIIADGNAQIVVARQDQATLAEEGMDIALIDDVEEALHAYSWVSSQSDTAVVEANINKEELVTLKELGFDVRGNLFKYGTFGCKKNNLPSVGAQLEELKEGVGDDDMIYDLLGCHQLFTANPGMCNGLSKFDPNWISQALELHNSLTALKAEVKNPDTKQLINQLEEEARQAYTFYYEKLVELREWGQFVFEDEDRADKYISRARKFN